jgi:hypothetical protein
MHIALDRTLILLIEHKDVMYSLIDYMDLHQRKDVSTEVFFNCIKHKITSIKAKNEVDRLNEAFSLDNLVKTGIIQFNKSRGIIAFQPAIVEIFRLFDKERICGLKKAEFENIRIQLENAFHQHQPLIFDEDNIQFQEQRNHLFDLLRQINTQVQNNTAHLQHEADRLSKHLDYDRAHLSLHESKQHREMLAQVKNIYDREIIPMLEFLNEKEYSKTKLPLTLIDNIRKLYDIRSYEDDSYYIGQYKLSILSHYKVVEKIKQTLQRYLHQEREHRLTYNAIEQAYLKLHELAQKTFTENLKEKYIFKEIDQQEIYYQGLKSHSSGQDALIEWQDRNHAVYFNEYLINKQAKQRNDTPAPITTFSEKNTAHDPHNVIKRKIKMIMDKAEIKPPIDDLYLVVHDLLAEGLKQEYHLKYVLYGVSCFKQKHGRSLKLQVSFEQPQRQIRYNRYILEYNKREFTT